MTRPLLIPFLLLSLCACKENPAPAGSTPAVAPGASSTGDTQIGTISSQDKAAAGGGSPVEGAGLGFDLPQGWQAETPESNMRLAQATIPGPGGPGQLAVFFFGPGGGGPVQANIDRWVGQMELAPGAEPRSEAFEADNYRITWVDVKGTLLPSTMGMGPSTPMPDARLLGAVVEGPGGPWFFKVTGPDSTVAPQRDAFLAMLKGVRGQ